MERKDETGISNTNPTDVEISEDIGTPHKTTAGSGLPMFDEAAVSGAIDFTYVPPQSAELPMDGDRLRIYCRQAWDLWNHRLKAPKYILAPMVHQSELHFRLLCRKYGTQLCYTPMLNARMLATSEKYRNTNFPLIRDLSSDYPEAADSPLVGQISCDDPAIAVEAARLLEPHVDAIDVNCGCPQGIAKRGSYGAYLLAKPDLMLSIARALVVSLKIPVFFKIRLVDDFAVTLKGLFKDSGLEGTSDLAVFVCVDLFLQCVCNPLVPWSDLQACGVSALCIHGRTKENKGHIIGPADWTKIAQVVAALDIPVIANGNISSREDADRCLVETGAAAVMSAEGLLEDPSLFNPAGRIDLDQLMAELVELYKMLPHKDSWHALKAHCFRTLHIGLQKHTDLRQRVAESHCVADLEPVIQEMARRRQGESPQSKLGWYFRHRKPGAETETESSEASAVLAAADNPLENDDYNSDRGRTNLTKQAKPKDNKIVTASTSRTSAGEISSISRGVEEIPRRGIEFVESEESEFKKARVE